MGKRTGRYGKSNRARVRGVRDTRTGASGEKGSAGAAEGTKRTDGWVGDGGEYKALVMDDLKHPQMVAYYREQGLWAREEEDAFYGAMRRPLPTNFRLSPCSPNSEVLLEHVKSEFAGILDRLSDEEREALSKEVDIDKSLLYGPQELPWYPGGLGWQLTVPRRRVRHIKALEGLLTFLKERTDCGDVSRQEAVSMIPPLVMDVQPHHRVLDMCAAPGSKTVQLVESLHAKENEEGLPSGAVVANDLDMKRSYLLAHQVRRISSPSFLVLSHDAKMLPNPNTIVARGGAVPGYYDRILADVPCSGDGTMRKNIDVWSKWTPRNGLDLHVVQLQIAAHGLKLLRHGGKMVYSTCSVNPIEDEAVVSALLRWAKGAVRLVDVSDQLPGLIRRDGVCKWTMVDSDYVVWPSAEHMAQVVRICGAAQLRLGWDREEGVEIKSTEDFSDEEMELARQAVEVATEARKVRDERRAKAAAEASAAAAEADKEAEKVPEKETPAEDFELERGEVVELAGKILALGRRNRKKRLDKLESTPLSVWAQPDAEAMHLERCMRILPHDQDTGGFFVSVLEVVGDLPREAIRVDRVSTLTTSLAAAGAKRPVTSAAEDAAKEEPVSSTVSSPRSSEPRKKRDRKDLEEGKGDAEEVDLAPFREQADKMLEGRDWMIPAQFINGNRDPILQQIPKVLYSHIAEWFGLPDTFPFENLWVRNGSLNIVSYFPEGLTKEVLLPAATAHREHFRTVQLPALLAGKPIRRIPQIRSKINIVVGGVRLFEARSMSKFNRVANEALGNASTPHEVAEAVLMLPAAEHADYRIIQDGCYMMAPICTKRVMDLSADQLAEIVTIAARGKSVFEFNILSQSTQDLFTLAPTGSIVARMDPEKPNFDGNPTDPTLLEPRPQHFTSRVTLSMWLGHELVNCMCSQSDLPIFADLFEARKIGLAGIERGKITAATLVESKTE